MGDPARLSAEVRAAYDSSAQDWAEGPQRMYAPLAAALVGAAAAGAVASGTLAGGLVLDIGAGTGVAGRAASTAGARHVVSVDLALGMLRRCGPDLHPLAADAANLPFRDRSFDVVLAAFSLSHVPDLGACLAEIRRVGLGLAASAFSPDWTHPAKEAVDAALASFGYEPPAWHRWLKGAGEPVTSDPAGLAAAATAVGFTDVAVRTVTVRTGLSTPAELAAWRLGMAQAAPFVRALEPSARANLRDAAEAAAADAGGGPLTVPMLVFTAR
ncbi:MAG TPA: class I SAM-dependent methyltransferase [Streptosporangiaceae bacterium]|nr:class I SAM-dependent methyltransferase [Streptosporangiaceae bacterium]